MRIYPWLYRNVLSRVDAETAHKRALRALRAAQAVRPGLSALRALAPPPDERLVQQLWGLPFANPLGLAAGLDKNAVAYHALLALGFGHVEIGTVTLRPQEGNAKPRMWRVAEQQAVINALGFPSEGSTAVRRRLLLRPRSGVVGVNLGKSRETPLERAADDYEALAQHLGGTADFVTINVSSPNTPGLRELQLGEHLEHIVRRSVAALARVAETSGQRPAPLLVKLSPDLVDEEVEAIAAAAVDAGAAGIVATNTTLRRDGVPAAQRQLPGGLSGPPLRARANEVARLLYRTVGDRVPIVGVGGIASADDVLERMRYGASLVQLYTGFIYEGPALPRIILRELSARADREGWKSLRELVGTRS